MEERTEEGRARQEAVRRGNPAFQQLADQIDDIADRLDQLLAREMPEAGAARIAAGGLQSATRALDSLADYLRASDLRSMRNDLEAQVRAQPIRTLLMAVGTGWIAGKVIR